MNKEQQITKVANMFIQADLNLDDEGFHLAKLLAISQKLSRVKLIEEISKGSFSKEKAKFTKEYLYLNREKTKFKIYYQLTFHDYKIEIWRSKREDSVLEIPYIFIQIYTLDKETGEYKRFTNALEKTHKDFWGVIYDIGSIRFVTRLHIWSQKNWKKQK